MKPGQPANHYAGYRTGDLGRIARPPGEQTNAQVGAEIGRSTNAVKQAAYRLRKAGEL